MSEKMKPPGRTKHDGLTLLGNSRAGFPESPEKARLETFPNPFPQRDYRIRIDSPQFTSLCPVTGQPDFAEILIEYIPDQRCLETKSLKLYLASFRNVRSFNEQVSNRILDDLVRACQPRWMRLEAKFAARGGLSLSVVVEHPNPGAPVRASNSV